MDQKFGTKRVKKIMSSEQDLLSDALKSPSKRIRLSRRDLDGLKMNQTGEETRRATLKLQAK